MSNARWRPSTSAADAPQSAPEASGAAQLQSVLDRLKQSPSLTVTQTAASTRPLSGPRDVRESRSRSPRHDVVAHQCSSARCRSSTSLGRRQPGAAEQRRQSGATPRSAERLHSRYSDIAGPGEANCSEGRRHRCPDNAQQNISNKNIRKKADLEQRTDFKVQNTDSNHGSNGGRWKDDDLEPTVDTAAGSGRGAAGPEVGRRGRLLAPADTSQSALSCSAGSSSCGSPAALTPDTDTQSSLTGSPGRHAPGPPGDGAARQFQARPRREPCDPAGQAPAERPTDGAGRSRPAAIPPIVRKTLMDFDRIQKLKYAAETAIREKKVFMIHGGYPSIRLALKRRGWVEKKYLINRNESEDDIDVSRWPIDSDHPVSGIGLADVFGLKGSKNSMILTRLLRDHQPNLIWSARREVIDYINLERDQLVNHFPRAPFNTKVGLCSLAQNLHWYSESLSADTFIPRAFRIGVPEEKLAFVEEFRLTACAGVLLWFRERYELHGAAGVEDADGEVPYSVLPTALQQCQAYIASRQHEDIEPSAFNRALWPHQWDNFLTNVYKLVHRAKKLEKQRDDNSTIIKVFYNRAGQLLAELTRYRPQTLPDGWLNIWIVKPGSSSRGRGIVLLRQLEDVLALVDSATQREGKYVVQKYIERPMLIYNTKFDIRQWFLVTDWNPLTVWMYKQSYLRFCSQQFTLGDLKEAVHLCNNAVQARYRNGERHAALPSENMWDSSTFQQFLKSREAGHAWERIIYPAMKSAIVSVCLASQSEVEPRRGCFELFGADFLLTEDFRPWLIEVNSSPAMGASTSVTAWLCAMCLEDVIRVVVDRRRDSQADCGEFECILQQPAVSSPRYLGIDLSVHGHHLKPPAAPPAAAPEPPAAPRSSVAPPWTGRSPEVFARLTALPGQAAVSASSQARRRSCSQAPPASPGSPASPGAGTPPGRNRSGSRRTAPAQPPAAQQRRQRAAGRRATLARRRSRTQLIQNSVRRLSDPRPRSGQRMDSGAAPVPPAASPVTRPDQALTVPRRQPPCPRRQLGTCGGRQETGGQRSRTELPAARDGSRQGPAAPSSTGLEPNSGPGSGSGPVPNSGSGGQRLAETAADKATESARLERESRPAPEASLSVAGSRYISGSLDKLQRMRRVSEEAVTRISSLSLAPAAADRPEDSGSSVQEVLMKQTGKVKWVAMPASQTSPLPAGFSAGAVTPTPRTSAPSPALRPATPAPRAVSPVPRALSPVPRAPAPVFRGVTSALRPAVSPRTVTPADSPRPVPRAGPPTSRLTPNSACWSTAAGQSPVPAPVPAPLPAPVPESEPGLLPTLSPPPPAAFTARITELRTLIDRAIEETREFLGRSRGSPQTTPLLSAEPPEPSAVPPVQPRPALSPAIVDMAARRPAWQRGTESPLAGSARPSPRRGAGRSSPVEPPRLTELVGLQGRRFLPQLPPEPPPRRSR